MLFKNFIGVFKDKPDLEIILTNDDIINITGMIGSGKTTLARRIKQENMEIVSLDWLFGASLKNRPEYIKNILDSFKNSNPQLKGREYANQIYLHLLQNLPYNTIYEGRQIYRYIDFSILKGKLIIKRTCLIKSYKQSFKRDMNNKIKEFRNKKIKIGKVLSRFLNRIKIPFIEYFIINKYIYNIMKTI